MKKVSLLAALSLSVALVACQGSTGSVTDVDVDADVSSSAMMMDDSSSAMMMDESSSSVEAMEVDADASAAASL